MLAGVTEQFLVHLKLFSNGDHPFDWNFNLTFYAKPLLQKTFNLIWIIFGKILNCKGQLGL